MKLLNIVAAAALASAASFTSANAAVTFEFDSNFGGSIKDGPTNGGPGVNNSGGGNVTVCNSQNAGGFRDICTVDNSVGFDYAKDFVAFNVVARENAVDGVGGDFTKLIQDLLPVNQGLGAISPGENQLADDQINFLSQEALTFIFTKAVKLSDIFLNDGLANDCPGGGSEGVCGGVGIIVDGTTFNFTDFNGSGVLLDGLVAATLIGQTFTFFVTNPGMLLGDFGYSIEAFTVSAIPVPGALPLLLSGIAGLGFASRRQKKTA